MKKYKHKNTDYIATETSSGNNYKVVEPKNFTIPKWIIENSNDWEEVIEKEYEILSFSNSKNLIWNRAKDDRFDAKWQMYRPTEEESLKEKGIIIHSIKRRSDGEVFSVGDKIDGNCGKNQEIVAIDTDWIYYKFNNGKQGVYTYWLKDIKKSECFLFITEDGVEIYDKNEKLFEVILSTYHLNENIPYTACNDVSDKLKDSYPSLVFSTKEAAQKWIDENKPQYSKKQVINILRGFDKEINEFMYEEEELQYSEYIEKYKNNENIL